MKHVWMLMAVCIAFAGVAQVEEVPLDSLEEQMIIIEGDSIVRENIALDEVYVFGPLKFDSYNDKLRYYILRRKTLKV